jgi:ElaB/YqjD/DUF883 family membrane-anchored ribosome-binding protein
MEDGRMDTARWNGIAARAQQLTGTARRFVHDRPLQAIAITIGVGFVVGKILAGREP